MTGKTRGPVIALAMTLLAVGSISCALVAPHRTFKERNPDAVLPRLMRDWKDAREKERERGSKFLESTEIRYEIERLAFEHPRHVPTLLANAQIAIDSGDSATAITYLDGVFSVWPSNPEAAILRSRIALADGNVMFARDLLDTQIELNPAHAELRAARAHIALLDGDFDGARDHLTAAENLGAEPWRIAYNRGLVEEKAGNAAQARRHYLESLELNPEHSASEERLNGLR